MKVLKRNGESEDVSFDKVINRIKALSYELETVDPVEVAQKVCARIYDGVRTSELDELAASICSSMMVTHPDYGKLASRICVSNHHKNTSPSFSETIGALWANVDEEGRGNPLVSAELYDVVMKNKDKLNAVIDYGRDFDFDFFGFKTLERSYLFRVKGRVVERPQHMFMRVALGIHGADVKDAIQTYNLMSRKYFIHATPTLFNAGTRTPQLSSCFLMNVSDSIADENGIYEALKEFAVISKNAGGMGMNIHDIRSNGSLIRGTNGTSTGIVPMLRVFNNTCRYVNQGGRRKGSNAVYIEPWHADIEAFLELRKPHGNEEERCRDLFLALWVNDLFMKRVRDNGVWSLFCPNVARGLTTSHGEAFEKLYLEYEAAGKYMKQVPAQKLWFKILESQIESGQPYMLYKDHANAKSNQKNLGTIKSSNLCVAPETMVLTEDGYFPIKDLVNSRVKVWNGHEFSEVVVKKTGVQQKLVRVAFSNGSELRCTPYHKFYTETSRQPSCKSLPVIVDAKDLSIGTKIIRFNTPILNTGTVTMKSPYTHGLFCAEGTYSNSTTPKPCEFKRTDDSMFCKRHQHYKLLNLNDNNICCASSGEKIPLISLYGEKKNLLQHIDYVYAFPSTKNICVGLHHDIEEKYYVPINGTIDTKLRWLEGYLDGDGCVIQLNGIKNIQVGSVEKAFLQQVLYLLQTLGINAKISLAVGERQTVMPDGHGGQKMYDCKPLYRLNIDCNSVINLQTLGFAPKRLDIKDPRKPHHMTNALIKVTKVEDVGDVDDTYCFNEPKKHAGIFNGILTGQCSEIIEYSDEKETAVCNLASLALPSFVEKGEDGVVRYNFDMLHEVAKVATKNLNKVIDINYYPVAKCRRSNLRHRPIGIGVQGLADVFIKMRMPFDSAEAKALNRDIFETIYHAAVECSMEIARKRATEMAKWGGDGEYCLKLNEFEQECMRGPWPGSYSTFAGSPASEGKLQFDLWGIAPSDRYDWAALKADVMKWGMRNSLLMAPMPTASTSQILGFNECFEPITSNIYKRKTLAGEFIMVNNYLVQDLIALGLWTKDIQDQIVINDGSIQEVDAIPKELKELYKTVWEIKQRVIIDMAADRGAFVCQSQSMNLFMEDPDFKKLTSMHFYAWERGLKTGMYYLRSKPKAQAQKFAIDPSKMKLSNLKSGDARKIICTDEVCTVCSS